MSNDELPWTIADYIINQQDFVDTTIYDAVCMIAGEAVPWDIELIGSIRDRILDWLGSHEIAEPDNIYPPLTPL